MKAILLNDTGASGHAGCQIVIQNVLQACEGVGIELVATSPTSARDDDEFVGRWWSEIDLVLLNGEGTLHDDQAKALELARAAEKASRAGKPVVLFNSVWQNNPQASRLLPHLDLIFCRESLSATEIERLGFEVRVIPDMVFASPLVSEIPSGSRQGTVILDSVDPRLARCLAWHACRCHCTYMPMTPESYERIRRRRLLSWALAKRSQGSPLHPGPEFSRKLTGYRAAISGRFHGTCLCFLANVPVASIASNTHKIEGLYLDAGLDPSMVVRPGHCQRLPSMSTLAERIEYARRRSTNIRRYVADAAIRIADMFARIAALERRRATH
jgi:hypothetical protein